MRKVIRGILFLMPALLAPVFGFGATPDWLRAAAARPAVKYADDVNGVVLFSDQETVVNDNGDFVNHRRIAYRILRPEGRNLATTALPFDGETKINYLHAWSLTAQGQEYESKEKDAYEKSLTAGEVFSDTREKILKVPGAEVGTVVGFESEQKNRPYLFQEIWYMQHYLPVERARFTLRLPKSWEYRASWINHADLAPVESNGTYVWEVADVPRIEVETHQPPYRALASAMVVTFFSEKLKGQTYRSWSDLGAWYSQLIESSRVSSPALQKKALELAPPQMPPAERIQALARFVQQDIRYAAIEIGIGGFRPHPAADVFDHRYGDCKDKSMLLGTMLAQIGVKSFQVLIHVQRGTYTGSTPPNRGFNHVILAVQLPEASTPRPWMAVYEHPKLGRLLIFDPTNDRVPLGQLPSYEQDNYALLVTDGGGDFIHLPASPPEFNKLKRTARLRLSPEGALQGEVEEISSGAWAASMRSFLRDESQQDQKKIIERLLGRTMTNFSVSNLKIDNIDDLGSDVVVHYKFMAEHYAQHTGPLLFVRPRIVGQLEGSLDTSKPRHYAYQFSVPTMLNETVEISLPEGFKADELPPAVASVFPFGSYNSSTEVADNLLRYKREYRVTDTLVPLDRIGDLKKLFTDIRNDEKNVATLKKSY
jgi:transglutaminase-like putative cysteine protease